ncbi:MAG: hypothetical protein OWT27_01250, partial [Firmicutes bacterium]|nr:hypothetical protein [Bacillota bacterium]
MKKVRLLATSFAVAALALATTSIAFSQLSSAHASKPADKKVTHRHRVSTHSRAGRDNPGSVRAELLRFIKTAPEYHYF